MKIKILILCVILSLSGCKIARAVGESLGIVDEEKTEQTQKPTKSSNKTIVPTSREKIAITNKMVGKWLWYSAVTIAVLLAIRFGIKKLNQKGKKKK